MQAAGDLVAVAAELAAGVEHGEHDLGRALALVRAGRVRVDGDAAAVVVDAAAAVGEQRDVDARAEAGHRLVDGVVDDLPDEVVEAGQTGGADVHARALADRVEALEDLDVLGAVVARPTGRPVVTVARRLGTAQIEADASVVLSSLDTDVLSVLVMSTRRSLHCLRRAGRCLTAGRAIADP